MIQRCENFNQGCTNEGGRQQNERGRASKVV